MSIFQSVVLGAIQGLSEFLPISSSGHLIIVPRLFNWPLQPLFFDVVLHLGTLCAVVIYFGKDIITLAKSLIFWKNQEYRDKRRYVGMLLIGIIPAGIAGFYANDFIESEMRSISIVIFNLIFWGVFLIIADWYSRTKQKNTSAKQNTATKKGITPVKALIIGIAQILSLIPGTSRSGITIGTGIFANLTARDAAHFSFLMSIPLIFGAGLFKTLEWATTAQASSIELLPLMIGFLTSAIVGWLAIKLFMRLLNSLGLTIFGIYRIVLAIGLMII